MNESQELIITIEEPMEVEVPFATATPVLRGEDKDGHFKEAIKRALDSDPEVLMIGEARDKDEVQRIIETVSTGQVVVTTY